MYLFDKVKTIASCDGLSAAVADEAAFIRLNSSEYVLFPGFCDVHVHFREPGFSYKETILSGSLAAAHGGYTAVCTMPNLNPVPDCPERLRPQREQIARDAVMAVFPYGAISVDEKGEQLADLEGLAPLVCAFSDDGHGVQDAGMMREAMQRCRALGKLIAAVRAGTAEKRFLVQGRDERIPGLCRTSESILVPSTVYERKKQDD